MSCKFINVPLWLNPNTFDFFFTCRIMANLSDGQAPPIKEVHINKFISPEPTLMDWYHTFGTEHQGFITSKIGPILSLLKVQFHWDLVRALHYFWDPTLMAFSFGPHILCPTIEEYTHLLRAPDCSQDIAVPNIEANPTYTFNTLLGVRRSEIILDACDNKGIKFATLISWFGSPYAYQEKRSIFIGDHETWKRNRVTAFILAAFATILFPTGTLHIHSRVAQLVSQFLLGCSYIPALLAEQFRSLTFLKNKKRGSLKTNAAILIVWFVSHSNSFGTLLPRKQSSRDLVDAFNDRFKLPIKVDLHHWIKTLEDVDPKELL